ncbi:MAG: DNA polymerase III subunit delta [Chitinophagales bacterium]|jgi:DNA polymerase-3 subunit delta|nr:DNA polymerase III subunit delta [Chitinophagales bacterium]
MGILKYEEILKNIAIQNFDSAYFLYGKELFFIEQIVSAFVNSTVEESEKSFCEHVIHLNKMREDTAKNADSDAMHILDICRSIPMSFSAQPRQLVLVKQAQLLPISFQDKLIDYLKQPNPITILVMVYEADKISTKLNAYGSHFISEPIRDYKIQDYIKDFFRKKQFQIENLAASQLHNYCGDNLKTIHNELDKLILQKADSKTITLDDVDKIVGYNRDFDVFKLLEHLLHRRLYHVVEYFQKATNIELDKKPPIPLIFKKITNLYLIRLGLDNYLSTTQIKAEIPDYKNLNDFIFQLEVDFAKNFTLEQFESAIALLYQYDAKFKGIQVENYSKENLMLDLFLKINYA